MRFEFLEERKFEARALEGVMLETLDHGVYKVFVDDNTGALRILESRHVTFDESRFPGVDDLAHLMSDEDVGSYRSKVGERVRPFW